MPRRPRPWRQVQPNNELATAPSVLGNTPKTGNRSRFGTDIAWRFRAGRLPGRGAFRGWHRLQPCATRRYLLTIYETCRWRRQVGDRGLARTCPAIPLACPALSLMFGSHPPTPLNTSHFPRNTTGSIKVPLAGVAARSRRVPRAVEAEQSGRYPGRAKEVAARTTIKHHKKIGHKKGE
jgi:hypothetical protein